MDAWEGRNIRAFKGMKYDFVIFIPQDMNHMPYKCSEVHYSEMVASCILYNMNTHLHVMLKI